MLQGGSIEKWTKKLVRLENTKIIFVWYQWEWTRWREILDWKEYIIIDWKAIPVKCEKTLINGFSSHAWTSDLLIFLNKFKKRGNKIKLSLTHWWNNRYLLEKLINSNRTLKRKYEIIIPQLKEKISIKF
jgi:predicted metal-dependent RNase